MNPENQNVPNTPIYSGGSVKVDRLSKWRDRFSNVFLFLGAFLVAVLINQFVFQSYEVDGNSMHPTLHNGDRLIIIKAQRTWATITRKDYVPGRGEIVVFHKPNGTADQLIKRVIGLPGDRVVVKEGKITVFNAENPNGFNPDSQPYGQDLAETYGNVDITVGTREVFVVGDNRVPGASLDSRSLLGNVPANKIVGVLAVRYLPIGDAKIY